MVQLRGAGRRVGRQRPNDPHSPHDARRLGRCGEQRRPGEEAPLLQIRKDESGRRGRVTSGNAYCYAPQRYNPEGRRISGRAEGGTRPGVGESHERLTHPETAIPEIRKFPRRGFRIQTSGFGAGSPTPHAHAPAAPLRATASALTRGAVAPSNPFPRNAPRATGLTAWSTSRRRRRTAGAWACLLTLTVARSGTIAAQPRGERCRTTTYRRAADYESAACSFTASRR